MTSIFEILFLQRRLEIFVQSNILLSWIRQDKSRQSKSSQCWATNSCWPPHPAIHVAAGQTIMISNSRTRETQNSGKTGASPKKGTGACFLGNLTRSLIVLVHCVFIVLGSLTRSPTKEAFVSGHTALQWWGRKWTWIKWFQPWALFVDQDVRSCQQWSVVLVPCWQVPKWSGISYKASVLRAGFSRRSYCWLLLIGCSGRAQRLLRLCRPRNRRRLCSDNDCNATTTHRSSSQGEGKYCSTPGKGKRKANVSLKHKPDSSA